MVSGYGQSNAISGNFGSSGVATSNIHSSSQQTSSSSYGGKKHSTTDKKTCCKGPFPGPNGSIYDSKPATAVGTSVKLTGSEKQINPSLSLHRPSVTFPGPSGSIFSSKPVNGIGTSGSFHASLGQSGTIYKSTGNAVVSQGNSGSYQPSFVQNHPSNTVVKPISGHSPSIVSEPNGNVQYGYKNSISPNTMQTSGEYPASASSFVKLPSVSLKPIGGENGYQGGFNTDINSKQTHSQDSEKYKYSCNGGFCSNVPPKTYLQPPQTKPVTETVQEQPNYQIISSTEFEGHKLQIPISVTIKPAPSYSQVPFINSGSNTEKPTSHHKNPILAVTNTENIAPKIPQVQHQQIHHIGSNQEFSSSGATAASSSSSGGIIGYQNPHKYGTHKELNGFPAIIDDDKRNIATKEIAGDQRTTSYEVAQASIGSYGSDVNQSQKKKAEGGISFVSGPEIPINNSPGYIPLVTENTLIVGGLKEAPRGSPFTTLNNPKSGTKPSGYDQPNEESAIVFIDGQVSDGGYSAGRGFASASSSSYLGNSGHLNTNIQGSLSNSADKKLGDTYSTKVSIVNGLKTNGQGILAVDTSSNKIGGNSASYGFAGSYGSSSGISCTSCGTAHREYANVPSSGNKNVNVYITSVPSGTGVSFSGASFDGKDSYGKNGGFSGHGGDGGFLSSIFSVGGAGTHSGPYGKSGGYSHSSSFSKSDSYASSSSELNFFSMVYDFK